MPRTPIDHNDKEARAYNWVLLATIVLLLSLFVQAPARVAANFLPSAVRVQLTEWGGTLWSGQVNALVKGVPAQIRWQFQPLALLQLKVGVKLEALTGVSHLQGQWRLGLTGWQLQAVNGELAGADLQLLLPGWQVPTQPVTVNNVSCSRQGNSWRDAGGSIHWQGGALDYVLNGQRQHLNLPPVAATLSNQQGTLILAVQEQTTNAALATFSISGEQLQSRLTQRLLAYSPNYHGVAEPDTIVITASQPWSSL